MKPGDVRPYLALFALSALAALAYTAAVPWYVWLTAGAFLAISSALHRHAPTLSGRRARIAVTLALVLLVAAPGVVLAAHIAGTVPVSDGVSLSSTDNTTVLIQGSTDAYLEDFTTLSGQVDVVTEAGNMTVFSAGDTHVAVQASEITGPWTNLTQIDTSANTIQVDPADKPQVTLGKQIDEFAYTGSYGVDDGTVDFVYAGASGESRVTIEGVPADQELAAIDADSGAILDAATSDSNGAVTFDFLTNSEHAVLLQTQDFSDPVLSNADPTGDQNTDPGTIEVDVNDADFPDADSVDVTIDLDGSQIHTETITANQTVSVSMPAAGKTGGAHTWEVEADPDFGDIVTETYEYNVPQNLTVRNARDHSEVIDSPITSNVTFFGEDEIVTRSASNGVIDMTGLPVNREFIAQVDPSDDNWTKRPLWVNSIYQQQDVYLLNTSAVSTIESRFVLDDPTDVYGPESVVFIQRPINVSGTRTWKTVHSDEFGAEGVTAVLEEGQRYRIRVQSASGDNQIIGPYRADVGETVTLQPGTPSVELGNFTDGWDADAALDNDTLTWAYSDPQDETDKLTVWIYEQGNKSNRLVANSTYFDLGNASAKHTLTKNETKKTWVVAFIVERGTDDFTHKVTLSNRPGLFGALGENWRLIIGLGSLFMFAGVFSVLNAGVGAVMVALLGGLWWWMGLLPGASSAIAIALAIFLAVINWVRGSGGL